MEKFYAKKYQEVGKLASIGASYREAFILLTAVHFDLFTKLHQQKYTAEQIADILKFDLRATTIFLDALAGLQFLKKERNLYSNAYYTNTYLVKGKKEYAGDILKNSYDQIPLWINMEKVLKTGKPILSGRIQRTKEEQKHFSLGMAQYGIYSAHKMLEIVDLRDVKSMLDIGGGAGHYAITFCQHYSKLHAVIIDIPGAIDMAVEQICDAGMEKRIKTLSGDYVKADYGSGYDLILISNIIHYQGLKDARVMFEKSYNALNEGGKLIVKDYFLENNRISPAASAIFSVGMLLSSNEGTCFPFEEISPLLLEAKYHDLEIKDITNQSKMIIAYK